MEIELILLKQTNIMNFYCLLLKSSFLFASLIKVILNIIKIYDVYDLNKNMTLVNHDQNTMIINKDSDFGNYIYKILKNDIDVIFLCDFFDNLFITKNRRNYVKIYILKYNSIQYKSNFPFRLGGLNEIIKLKDNSFIMYSKDELLLFNQK